MSCMVNPGEFGVNFGVGSEIDSSCKSGEVPLEIGSMIMLVNYRVKLV